MPNAANKANWNSQEAQQRLVRAIVAAHPETKWNYKEIAACFGSDMTEHSLNHRFRRLRAQSVIIREARQQGYDIRNMDKEASLPGKQEAVDKNNIAKYFGGSTPDGIQWQFRAIKKDAKELRKAGGNMSNESLLKTPSKTTSSRGGGSRSGSRTMSSTGKRSRQEPLNLKHTSSDEEDSLAEIDNWSDQEDTPSKRPKNGAPGQRNGTPSRQAATKASATIADASAQLMSSESPPDEEAETPPPSATVTPTPRKSIFGNMPAVQPPPAAVSHHEQEQNNTGNHAFDSSAFAGTGHDAFFGTEHAPTQVVSFYEENDGEF